MRLYLSSFGLGNDPALFRRLANGPNVGLILNALDNAEVARDTWLSSQSSELVQLGFNPCEIDLREYFGQPLKLIDTLKELDAVWVNGGNTFILRRAMRESGFDSAISSLLAEDHILYGGFSAGVVVLHDSLRGLEIVDDPDVVPNGYPQATVWQGLGLLPFSVVVHFRSDHPETEAVEGEKKYYEKNGLPFRTIRDGEALVVDGDMKDIRLIVTPEATAAKTPFAYSLKIHDGRRKIIVNQILPDPRRPGTSPKNRLRRHKARAFQSYLAQSAISLASCFPCPTIHFWQLKFSSMMLEQNYRRVHVQRISVFLF